jgi:hypothetical protein
MNHKHMLGCFRVQSQKKKGIFLLCSETLRICDSTMFQEIDLPQLQNH